MAQVTFDQALQLALQHHQAGQFQQAEQIYMQILAHQPNHADALHFLGVLASQVGKHEIALNLISRSLSLKPNNSAAHINLGNALKDKGQRDAAVAAYRQAIALQPNSPEAHNNLGNVWKDQGNLNESIAAYRQAIALKPNYPEALNNLGNVFREKRQLDDAIDCYRAAIALMPNNPELHNNLAIALRGKGLLDEAIDAYLRAISIKPDYPEAYNNLGNARKDNGQTSHAIAVYRQAIFLNPNYPEAHSNLGAALIEIGDLDHAVAALQKAIALKPNYSDAYNNLAIALKDRGELDDALAAAHQAMALKPESPSAHSNLVYTLHFHPDYDARAIAEEHRRWNHQHAAPLTKEIQPHANDRNPARRLRIGYISPDFREHPVGRFILPLFANHDPTQFEVFAYSQVAAPDSLTQQIRSNTQTWRSIVGLSDAQCADLIRQDKIDILIDLTMHMARNRLLVFARKPAPVQLTYLAYCSTTGLQTIDYRLSDPHLDPPSTDLSVYSEQTIRLPETYWCYQPSIALREITPLPALKRGHITFGCLNNFCKVSHPTLETWSKILRDVPTSHLLLHTQEGVHRQRVRDHLEKEGIDPTRIRFVPFQSAEKYFDLYHQIDITLDTTPYSGGTTTCDALWMGVPVITLSGKTAVGRGGQSILTNLGLPELITTTPETYAETATQLATNLPRLIEFRATLRPRMQKSSLMNAKRFAKNVESAYRQIWQTHCATNAAESKETKTQP
ncbi:MAG: tetratricopeptide repeat protein [Planctomycetota bacterium]|nr:tetratricopeptide repeat protein [Planctomycetota bacterium]